MVAATVTTTVSAPMPRQRARRHVGVTLRLGLRSNSAKYRATLARIQFSRATMRSAGIRLSPPLTLTSDLAREKPQS